MAGRATLQLREDSKPLPKNPALPRHPERKPQWTERTREWWKLLWHSELAPEFLYVDLEGLYLLAELIDEFYRPETSSTRRLDLAKEIRLQRAAFGLTPLDRRRLQWEVERAEDAQDRGARRQKPPKSPKAGEDARLSLVQ